MSLLDEPYSINPVAEESRGAVKRPLLLSEKGVYLTDAETAHAVNLALHLGVPLLITGEPGVGKTRLAYNVADQLGWGEVLRYQVKSDSESKNVLYYFDALKRLYDAQRQDSQTNDPTKYRRFEAMGKAITQANEGKPSVLLIDEIDKAPNDFPNGLLQELEDYQFYIPETEETYSLNPDAPRPLVIITSNSERRLPDPFLRRCLVHEIPFPKPKRLKQIVQAQLQLDLSEAVLDKALEVFHQLKDKKLALSKPPSTADLLMWLRALSISRVTIADFEGSISEFPSLQALLKQRDDIRKLTVK